MSYLRPAIKESRLAINKILIAFLQRFLYPLNSLEPYQFNNARFIFKPGHHTLCTFFTQYFYFCDFSGKLDIFCHRAYAADLLNFSTVNIPQRVMIEQVIKRKNA